MKLQTIKSYVAAARLAQLAHAVRRQLRAMTLLGAGVALLGGAASPALAAAAAAGPKTVHPSAITWGSCAPPPTGIPDAGQQCGTVSVPLNYKDPSGRKINVAVSRIPAADPAHRRGVLLVNPGGPGGSGLDLPRIFTILLPQSVLNTYDLVGFDPRGVGQSTPVSCGMTAAESQQAYVPLTQNNSFNDTASLMHTVADKCAATSGDILPYITTANTARDMDQIRSALGESKISYFGYSYGTYLGSVYASLYPNQTDRFVLDSSINPGWVWRDQFRAWGPGGAVRFPDFLNFAASQDDAYHLGSTPAAVHNTYNDLVARLDQHPQPITGDTPLNGAFFRELTFGGLYNDADFAGTAAIWQAAEEALGGSASALHQLQQAVPQLMIRAATSHAKTANAVTVPADNEAASGLAIVCNDVAWPSSPLQYQLGLSLDKTLYPDFGELGSNIWPCAYWHYPPKEAPVTINSDGPANILMAQNLRDPATPYWGALSLRATFGQRARMMTVDQGGHAIYELMTNSCANDTITAYLANGTYPASDTFCAAQSPTMTPMTPKSQTNTQTQTTRDKAAQILRRLVE